MRIRRGTVVVLAAAALVLGACSNDDKDSSADKTDATTTSQSAAASASEDAGDGEALAEYAGKLCGIQSAWAADVQTGNQQLLDPATTPEQAAAILSDLSTSFGGAGFALDELGDPPNGEADGLMAEAKDLFTTTADKLQGVSDEISSGAITDSATASAKLQPITDEFTQGLQALNTEYPTPDLDAAQAQIPGCGGNA